MTDTIAEYISQKDEMDICKEQLTNQGDEISRLKKQLKETGDFYLNFYEGKISVLVSKLSKLQSTYKDEIKRLAITNDKL